MLHGAGGETLEVRARLYQETLEDARVAMVQPRKHVVDTAALHGVGTGQRRVATDLAAGTVRLTKDISLPTR